MKKLFALLMIFLFILPSTAYAVSPESESSDSLKIGDTVILGCYEQDGNERNGFEPIEWTVLDINSEESKALVISKYNLDRFLYHSKYEPVTWETCDLRAALNSTFLEKVFSAEEQERILFTDLETADNEVKQTKGGSSTTDRIFLLSIEEAERYFPSDNDRKGIPTVYLSMLCSCTDGLQYTSGIWWLRSPGEKQPHAAVVFGGRINLCGWGGNLHKLPVRPAMWISIAE